MSPGMRCSGKHGRSWCSDYIQFKILVNKQEGQKNLIWTPKNLMDLSKNAHSSNIIHDWAHRRNSAWKTGSLGRCYKLQKPHRTQVGNNRINGTTSTAESKKKGIFKLNIIKIMGHHQGMSSSSHRRHLFETWSHELSGEQENLRNSEWS